MSMGCPSPARNTGPMGSSSGRLAGLAQVRDKIAVTYQSQLDEIARGLIGAFAESDQSATPTLPDAPGLFTYARRAGHAAGGTIHDGLAGIDQAQSERRTRRRAATRTGCATAASSRQSGLSLQRDRWRRGLLGSAEPAARRAERSTQSFDPAAAAGAICDRLRASPPPRSPGCRQARKSASDDADYKSTLAAARSSEALSSATGVNLDEEMTLLLELERSYQASSKLITTIDNMYGALLSAAGR